MLPNVFFEVLGVLQGNMREVSIELSGGCLVCSWRARPYQQGGMDHVNDKQAMIPNPVPRWHDAHVGDGGVGCCPDAIDWKLAPKECGSNLLARVCSHYLLHPQPSRICEYLSDLLFIKILVCLEANHYAVSYHLPCTQ
jgi:hypothetical protein